jgi:hypothetical protein
MITVISRIPPGRVLLCVALLLLALAPRALAVGKFVTVDEAYHWFDRVETFTRAVQQGAYADTNIIGHPGVTTMWLGSFGLQAHRAMVQQGYLAPAGDESPLYRAFLRFPLALAASVGVALAYLLMRRVWGEKVALLAALLWAAEPFLVAHGQLLHLDSLLTTLCMLSLLAALLSFRMEKGASQQGQGIARWDMLALSAVAGGLAFLTKSPSVILAPMLPLVALVGLARQRSSASPLLPLLGRGVLALVVWGAIAALVWVAFWPAARVDLPGAVGRVVRQATDDGGSPHGWGNYFLGRTVDDPGLLFYPVAVALRLAPWTLVGLVAALFLPLRAAWQHWRASSKRTNEQQPHPFSSPRLALLLLALFVLLFLAMMSIPPKKFDRYALPIFPALDIFAAYGLVRLAGQWGTRAKRAAVGALVAALVATLLWYHPYELAYYNPLIGGGAVASWALPIGWGEGYEQAGAFISAQPNGCERGVATWYAPVLYRYLCNHWVVSLDKVFTPGAVDYAVLYIDQVQRGNKSRATAFLRQNYPPLHTVRIHGIDYAWVYQLPLPNEHRLSADFGESLRLIGYDVESAALHSSGVITLTTQWQPLAPMHEDYTLFVHVLTDQGDQVGHIDVPPGGPPAPTSTWPMHSYRSWHHPISLPRNLPPGRYWIGLGVYHPETFARLDLHVPPRPDAPDDGPNVLMLAPITIE